MAILGDSKITTLEIGKKDNTTLVLTVNGEVNLLGKITTTSTVLVTNLNADKVDGKDVEETLSSSNTKIPTSKAVYDSTLGNIKIGTVSTVTGNAEVTATTTNRVTTLNFKIPKGESTYEVDLSPDSVVLSADSAGKVSTSQFGEVSRLIIYHGSTKEDLTSWTLSCTPPTGVTAAISTAGIITISAATDSFNSGLLSVTAKKGSNTFTTQLRVTKVKDGAKGATGATGSAGPAGPAGKISGAEVTVDATTGTPSGSVTLGGTPEDRSFKFSFSGLKGATGPAGAKGNDGFSILQADRTPYRNTLATLKTFENKKNDSWELTTFSGKLGDTLLIPVIITDMGDIRGYFPFTITTWDASAKTAHGNNGYLIYGDKGATGPQGAAGPAGPSGAKGDPGADAIFLKLSPSVVSVPASNTGEVTGLPLAKVSTISVIKGSTDISSSFTFSVESSSTSNIVASIVDTNKISITGWSRPVDERYYNLKVTATPKSGTGYSTLTGYLNLYKTLVGPRGATGDNGITPAITASATVDKNTMASESTPPTCTVTKGGTATNPTFAFNFKNILPQRAYLPLGTILLYSGVKAPVGALPCNGQTIENADTKYPDFWKWVNEQKGTAGQPNMVLTPAEYDAQISANGVCGKYAIDGTTLRLPLLKHFVQGTITTSEIGTFTSDTGRGFTGEVTFNGMGSGDGISNSGVLKAAAVTTTTPASYNNALANGIKISINSADVWGANNGTEFKPKSISYQYYVQVYQSVSTTLTQVQLENLASSLESYHATVSALEAKVTALENRLKAVGDGISVASLTV